MQYPKNFQITTPSDLEVEVARDFHAPRPLVFDAFTKPELVRQWLLGPPGWTMPVCEIDLCVGGAYRYVWRKAGVPDMGMGGVFLQVESPMLLEATEKFDEAWYPGEAVVRTSFEDSAPLTRVKIRIRYESREARDTAMRSGMEHGMAAGFDRMDALVAPASN